MFAYSVLFLAIPLLLSIATIKCDETLVPNDEFACSKFSGEETECPERISPESCLLRTNRNNGRDLCSKISDSLEVEDLKTGESNFQKRQHMKESEGLPFLSTRKILIISFSALFGVLLTHFASERLRGGGSAIFKRASSKLVIVFTFTTNLLKSMYEKMMLYKIRTVLKGVCVFVVLYAVFPRQYLNDSALKLSALTSLLSVTTITCEEAPMPNDGSACSAMETTCSERNSPNCDLCSKTVDSLKVSTKTAALKISESNFQEKELMKENEGFSFLNPRKLFVMSFSALFGVCMCVLLTYFASHRLPKGARSISKRASSKLVIPFTFAANLLKSMYEKIKLYKIRTVLSGIFIFIVLFAIFLKQYLNQSAFKLPDAAMESVGQMLLQTEYIYDFFANTIPVAILTFLVKDRPFPKTKSWFRDEYDYIIIGAGSAGSVMAARLSEMSCMDVLLLEAGSEAPILTEVPGLGGLYFNSYAAWEYWTTPQRNCALGHAHNQVKWITGKAIGGSSVINAMVYIRGGRRSYDRWAEDGATGWGYEDVLPYFMKLEDNQNMDDVDQGYHGAGGPLTVVQPYYESELKQPILDAAKRMGYDFIDCNGRNQTGFCNIQVTVRDGLRISSAKAYLVPAEERPNLDILKNAFATKIVFRRQKAVGVEFQFSGKTRVVRARREIIISAGTVRTPQLLMLSGIGPCDHLRQHNITCIRDSPVGKNLQDHYGTATVYEIRGDITPIHKKILNPLNALQFITGRKGPYASPEQVLLAAFIKRVNASHSDFPRTQLLWVECATPEIKQFMDPEVYNKKFSKYEGKTVYACISTIVQSHSRGRITLASSDPQEAPLIDPNYHSDPRDMEYLLEGMKVCEDIAASKEMQKIGSTPLETVFPGCEDAQGDINSRLECYARVFTMSHLHPTGTTRMGKREDPSSVVDHDLRVIGVENLRVVDASIMPTAPNGNTHAPTVMIAEKISDKMKQDIECVNQRQ